MDLIIHPGHGKCGSTSIQKYLYDNRASLSGEGYAIPDKFFRFSFEKESNFSSTQPAVHYLAKTCEKRGYSLLEKRIDEALENAQQSNIHTFVLSAENLSNSHTKPLHEIFSRYFNVKKVLYYTRRQDDLLLSAWQQWGHKTGTDLTGFCQRQMREGLPAYIKSAAMMESCYGKGILEVVPFSRSVFRDGDLISDFAARTGLGVIDGSGSVSRTENKSLNPLVCEYLAQVPNIYVSVHDNHPKADLEKFKLEQPWLFDPWKKYLAEADRKLILDHFEAENRELHSTYFPDISFDLLFGMSANGSEVGQEQIPESLEPHQREFLRHWVKKWRRRKPARLLRMLIDRLHAVYRTYLPKPN